jgi:uncharacterized protein with NRDE domain
VALRNGSLKVTGFRPSTQGRLDWFSSASSPVSECQLTIITACCLGANRSRAANYLFSGVQAAAHTRYLNGGGGEPVVKLPGERGSRWRFVPQPSARLSGRSPTAAWRPKSLMCILAVQYKFAKDAPILLAQNREERLDRPTQAPRIQSGRPRVVCGIDRKAGGTWLGVNQHGLVVAVANRPKTVVPSEPRSRGLLCRELLNFRTAQQAADHAVKELKSGCYAGANYLCMGTRKGVVVYAGDRIEAVELAPGLHLLTNGDLDDPYDRRQEFARRLLTLQRLDSAVAFLAVASRTFSRRPDSRGRRGVIISGDTYGTVSSTLVSLPKKMQNAVYQYAPGPPSDHAYDDCSALLRQVLSTDK